MTTGQQIARRALRVRTLLVLAAALVLPAVTVVPAPKAAAASPSSPSAALAFAGVDHALQNRNLVISGWVRNTGSTPVSRLVIDAWGYGPDGEIAIFGSDGIPWTIPTGRMERFQIFLPIGKTLIRTYTVAVTASRPRVQSVPLMRSIPGFFYRQVILADVKVQADVDGRLLTFRASAEGWPVSAVMVRVGVQVDEPKFLGVRSLEFALPVDTITRIALDAPILRLLSIEVRDITLSPAW